MDMWGDIFVTRELRLKTPEPTQFLTRLTTDIGKVAVAIVFGREVDGLLLRLLSALTTAVVAPSLELPVTSPLMRKPGIRFCDER